MWIGEMIQSMMVGASEEVELVGGWVVERSEIDWNYKSAGGRFRS